MFLYYDDNVVSIVAELLLNPNSSHTTTLNKLEKNNKHNINYNPFVIIFLLALYKSQIKINK
jgi:hypothetical protein